MRTFLKVIGIILVVIFGLDIIYIASGLALARHSLDDVIWGLFWAAGIVTLGIIMISGKAKLVGKTDSKSHILGILSLTSGIIGIFWWPAVLGIIAVTLAILQFRRRTSKVAIAGLCLGVIDFILAAVWKDLGLMPSIF